MNMKDLMAQATQMQSRMKKEMAEFDVKVFEYTYQNAISVLIKGSFQILEIKIFDESLIDASDKETLQAIIATACNQAINGVVKGKNDLANNLAPGLSNLI